MALIHSIAAFDKHGLQGIQSLQRDWSPYVVHFTSFAAMSRVRNWRLTDRKPTTIATKLREADDESLDIVTKIASSSALLSSSPSDKNGIAKCVCFSECNLPGLVGHSERYGRFGFVFEKTQLFKLGGRPCCYVAPEEYKAIAKIGRGQAASTAEGRLFSLANLYRPSSERQVQDFSHEREWRIFSDLDLASNPPRYVMSPERFLSKVGSLFDNTLVIPLDTLFTWGA